MTTELFTDEFLRSKFVVKFGGEGARCFIVGSFERAIALVNQECCWDDKKEPTDTDAWSPRDLDFWTKDDGGELFMYSCEVGEMSHLSITRVHEDRSASTYSARVRLTVSGLPQSECFVAEKSFHFAGLPRVGDSLCEVPGHHPRERFFVRDVCHLLDDLLTEGPIISIGTSLEHSGDERGKQLRDELGKSGWSIGPWD